MNSLETVKNCKSLEELVILINNDMTSGFDAEVLAGAYAYNETMKHGNTFSTYQLEMQLEYLKESGAIFEFPEALTFAKSYIK